MITNNSSARGIRRAIFFWGLGAVILGCVAYLFWAARTAEPMVEVFRTETTDRSLIEANADITLPPSAHDIHALVDGFREFYILVRFSMNADELALFLRSSLCRQPLESTASYRAKTYEDAPIWWTPGQSQSLQTCSGEKEGIGQQILVDTSNPMTYVVFVDAGTQ